LLTSLLPYPEWTEKRPFIAGPKNPFSCLAFSPDSKYLLAGDETVLGLWDLTTGKLYRLFDEHTDKVACVAFHPDGRHFAYAGFNKKIHLWDLEKNMLVKTFEGHQGPVASIAFSPDGTKLASGSLGAAPEEPRTIRL
jgi:WD40 repeat protein